MSGYVKGLKTEWKKIVWPTRKELASCIIQSVDDR